jgi:hypothetical protein
MFAFLTKLRLGARSRLKSRVRLVAENVTPGQLSLLKTPNACDSRALAES